MQNPLDWLPSNGAVNRPWGGCLVACPNEFVFWVLVTPWKINMEHNNGGLEDDFPF